MKRNKEKRVINGGTVNNEEALQVYTCDSDGIKCNNKKLSAVRTVRIKDYDVSIRSE